MSALSRIYYRTFPACPFLFNWEVSFYMRSSRYVVYVKNVKFINRDAKPMIRLYDVPIGGCLLK